MSLKDWFALVRECPNPWREIRVLRTERDGLIAAGVESDKREAEWEEKCLDAEKRFGKVLLENWELRARTKVEEWLNECLLDEFDALEKLCTERENDLREVARELEAESKRVAELEKSVDFERSEKEKITHMGMDENARANRAEKRVAKLEAQLAQALDVVETLRWIAREGD